MAELVDEYALLRAKKGKLEALARLRKGLPHLYGFTMYPWQRKFWNNKQTFQFIFKANQIGGSSVMIKKMINYATEPAMWTQFSRAPKAMMYLYPDKATATREWETKWVEFMPNGEFKDHPQYGWNEDWEGKYINSVTFKTGVILYFKTYGSGAENLQATSPSILACDEELPEELFPELQLRISSPVNGGAMFWMGCTPTKGQKYLQKIQTGETKIPDSFVLTVSMYDCLHLENGQKSLWTIDKIKQIEQALPNKREIEVRVHGLFKPVDNVGFPSFSREKNFKPYHPVTGWELYCGIDYGIGGSSAHPSSIVFIAVNPLFTQARVVKCWRGDGISTTVDDVLNQYLSMLNQLGYSNLANTYYDYACGEMGVIAARRGITVNKANKDRKLGIDTLNSVFKNAMMIIYDTADGEGEKLAAEIEGYNIERKVEDDLVDALRYGTINIPFNFENINVHEHVVSKQIKTEGRETYYENEYDDTELEDEIDEWNSMY